MSNYNESDVSGTKYTRCKLVIIHNTFAQPPVVEFQEEDVLVVGTERIILQGANKFVLVNFDPTRVVQVIDPATGSYTGESISYPEMYTYLYSAYIDAALERDAQQISQEA